MSPEKCEKSYFSTKYRISAQNRIRPCVRLFSFVVELSLSYFYVGTSFVGIIVLRH